MALLSATLRFLLVPPALPSARPRRRPFAHEPGIRLVCALITLLEPPSSLATLEINGGLPIVTASYVGWKGVPDYISRAPTNVRFFFPYSVLIISANIDSL